MAKALLIVEGESLEPRFFTRMSEVCGMDVEIVSLRANIYLLYRKLKEYEFEYDVRVALKELIADENAHRILSDRYAYTYLIFDCDAHHGGKLKAGDIPSKIEDVVGMNYSRLEEMVGYFTDETDPERGRLFVNYPMMESYRDCDSKEDDSFKDRNVRFEDLSSYKKLVGQRRMASLRIETMTQVDFDALAKLNLKKWSHLMGNGWRNQTEEEYNQATQLDVLKAQMKLVPEKIMAVINTSLLLSLDYYRRCT